MKPYESPEIQRELDIIKTAVLAVVPDTEAIYLFGSYAYGNPHKNSDLDVYVVVPDSEPRNQIDLESDMYLKFVRQITLPVDILVQYSTVFDRRSNGPTLAKTVSQKGVRVYG